MLGMEASEWEGRGGEIVQWLDVQCYYRDSLINQLVPIFIINRWITSSQNQRHRALDASFCHSLPSNNTTAPVMNHVLAKVMLTIHKTEQAYITVWPQKQTQFSATRLKQLGVQNQHLSPRHRHGCGHWRPCHETSNPRGQSRCRPWRGG